MTAEYRYCRMRNDDTTAECRPESRKRRMEMKDTNSGTNTSISQEISNVISKLASNAPFASSGEDVDASSYVRHPALSAVVEEVPVYGSMSVAGRMRQMEDALTIKTNMCMPEINGRLPVHFFGVYDGHGGPQVAAFCREKLHLFLNEELMLGGAGQGVETVEHRWQLAMKRCFKRMDEVVLGTCICGNIGYDCGRHPAEMGLIGCTAVVAVITAEHIVVANCGDSRAVLSRAGRTVPLSVDQKPDRADELARIESLGGRVIFLNGARVEGILAMSRAIGDKFLKSFVISEPEISFTRRDPEDECLILASDGLWDVISSDLACDVARECLKEIIPPSNDPNARSHLAEEEGAGTSLYSSRSASAAALLTRLALGRKSCDNISVIVIDLKT